ncbi:reverse transcriptase domain-containing protein [Tanacetum coccineum]
MYVDGGSSMEVLYEHCFNRLQLEIKNQMIPVTTSLTGFSGETIWPLGQLRLLVTVGDTEHFKKAWMNFMIVRSPPPYNGIIRRPGIREIQAVPSTTHGMLKFPVDGGIVTIRSTILTPTKCATIAAPPKDSAKKADARHENFKVAIHPDFPDQEIAIGGAVSTKARMKLCTLLKGNLDIFAWQPSDMTGVPRSIAEHRINIREGYLPVRQKKRGQSLERAKAIQTKDCYPLPEIDWKVESLYGYPFKCFLDAYKGYHQIQMAESDEEKTAFHTPHGVYCSTKMPFGLKNARATYQRLVDKAFDKQVGQNLEVYVDDLVIKSHTETEMLRDIEETFCTLRKINMKLNPKKCTFWAVEGIFLGFLSKSAEKSLPLFKTLKKCIKKSNFYWTPEAEQAFKQLEQHISELPMLVAPRPKEELIMYLSASHGAVGAVLMTERDMIQTPVYFVSRALQGPELNYTPMEKLILALVCAAKRLRRYFQAYLIAVIMDQPIKKIMSRPDVAGRLQKWSVMLGEHNITYPTRTSVKGQILADFLVEKPDEVPLEAPVKDVPLEGTEFTYALRFQFTASNNEAEYEALIAGLRITAQMGVLVEVLQEKSIQEKDVAAVVDEEGPTWMTPITDYLKEGILPDDRKEASKLLIKARHQGHAVWILLANHASGRTGCDTQGSGKVKFLIVAMDYFTKWIEAKAVATISGSQSSNGDTPFSLTYGTEAVIPAEIRMPTYRIEVVDAVHNDEELRLNLDLLEERRERAAIREAKAKSKMTKYYNARVRGVTFKPVDFVYRNNKASHARDGGKLSPK